MLPFTFHKGISYLFSFHFLYLVEHVKLPFLATKRQILSNSGRRQVCFKLLLMTHIKCSVHNKIIDTDDKKVLKNNYKGEQMN